MVFREIVKGAAEKVGTMAVTKGVEWTAARIEHGVDKIGKKLDNKVDRIFVDSERPKENELPESDLETEVTDNEDFSDSERPKDSSEPEWDEREIDEKSLGVDEEDSNLKDVDEKNIKLDVQTEQDTIKTEKNDKKDSPEYKEDGTRDLTEDEKNQLKEKLEWSDDKLKKCTIDEDGTIHFKTDRCDLEGKTAENGVPYERKTVEINGVKIEGVFPKFESVFNTKLDNDKLTSKTYAKDCNAKLKEAVENNNELKNKFTLEQQTDIAEGRTPIGYVWHHNEEPGKMQLVKREDHDRAIGGAAHTGGNSLWGADSVDSNKKGESF